MAFVSSKMLPHFHEDNYVDEDDLRNLVKFRKMVKDSQNQLLNLMDFDDETLLRLIRRPKMNLNESLQALIHIVESKFSTHILLFEKAYPSAIRHVFEKRIFGVLKHRDQLHRAVIWFRLGRWDPNVVSETDLLAAIIVTSWEVLASRVTQLKGVVGIFDASECTSTHIKTVTPLKMQMKINPFHLRGIHVMYIPTILNFVLSICKHFLSKKYRKMLHFHGRNKRKMHEHVPKTILPNFLGGILTEEEATDYQFLDSIIQKDAYYKGLIDLGKKEIFERYPDIKAEFERATSYIQ